MQNHEKQSIREKYQSLLRTIFSSALQPAKVSLSISLGFLWGVFPVIGTSTVLCAVTSFALKLNLALIQGVNYLVYPLQIALLIPYFYAGNLFTGLDVSSTSVEKMGSISFSPADLSSLSDDMLHIVLNTLLGWLLLVPAFSLLLYLLSGFILRKRFPSQ